MNRRKPFCSLLALLLLSAMLFAAVPSAVFAYGASDQKLIITHINQPNSYEGAAIIIAGTHCTRLGDKGNYAWWKVLIFDWDATQKCFVLTEKNLNANNSDKSNMEIPKNGFAYGLCVGNDYSGNGGINYITQRMKDCYSYVDSIAIGTKAYLYGTSLANGLIQNNGKNWYAADYESKSYIKIGTPEAGALAYDPEHPDDTPIQYVIEPTYVNDKHYATGDCNLFTPEYGSYVGGDYSWWYSFQFTWDAKNQCYICSAQDVVAGAGNYKNPNIPENGFVLMDCSSAFRTSLLTCQYGTKAYLYKEGSKYKITLNLPLEGKTQVTPANAQAQADMPVLQDVPENGTVILTDRGGEIKWNAVPGATEYVVSMIASSPNPLGKQVIEPKTVTGTSLTIPEKLLSVGSAYTVFVSAKAAGKTVSVAASARIYCVSEGSLTSKLQGKTVLAFGDSLTARSGWVSMLGGYIGTEVINAGVGGDTTFNGKVRFRKDVLAKKPDVALICFGMNDQAQVISRNAPNVSLADYRANLTEFITTLQAAGTDVILIAPHDAYSASGYYKPGEYGLNYAYGNMKQFCEVIRSLAIEYGCGLIDIYAETQSMDMGKFLNAGDGIHQSTYGHSEWARMVSNYLLARYNGTDSATVTVNMKDNDGKLLGSYQMTAAIGAKMLLPAPEINGYTCTGNETIQTVTKDLVVTYTYYQPSSDYIVGDVSGNGKLDAADYLLLKRYVLKTLPAGTVLSETQLKAADATHDNRINASDYYMIKRAILAKKPLA